MQLHAHTHAHTHVQITIHTNRNMANTAGIYHSRLFVFMSPLSGPSPLLNCVLRHFGSIMLPLPVARKESEMGCVCVVSVCVQCTLFRDIWAVCHPSSMSGLASHTTNGSFMISAPSLGDQNNIKHTIPEPVVQKCNNIFFLIPALMKFIRNSLV